MKSFHGHHSLGDTSVSPTVEKIDVEVDTVDRYCASNGIERIDFLKIDVEGFEEDVLRGATTMLKRKSVGIVLFNWRQTILESIGKNCKDIIVFLLEHGYNVFTLDGRVLTEELEHLC